MDITTILGLLLGFGSMIGAIVIEAGFETLPVFFVQIGAWLIILGGTFGCTLLSSKMKTVKRIPTIFIGMFKEKKIDHISIIYQITSLAEKARREGLISLESSLPEITNPMLSKGLQLVIDGTDPELVEAVLQTNLVQLKGQSTGDATVFETLGGFAPTMGIVGTVMGLVGALGELAHGAEQNDVIGALAVAFIATFWGIGLANLVFLPMCNKIRARWSDELILGQIIIEGVMAIQGGNNPRIVQERLLSFLAAEDAAAAAQQGPEGDAK